MVWLFAWIVDKNNSNTNKSFSTRMMTAITTNATNPRRVKREKRKWIPQVKSLLSILSFFSFSFSFSFSLSLSLYRVLFSSLLGVCRSSTIKSSSLVLLFLFFLHTTTFRCAYAPAFIIIQPFDRRISCSRFKHIFNHYSAEKERKKRGRQKERKKERIRVRKWVYVLFRLKMSSL